MRMRRGTRNTKGSGKRRGRRKWQTIKLKTLQGQTIFSLIYHLSVVCTWALSGPRRSEEAGLKGIGGRVACIWHERRLWRRTITEDDKLEHTPIRRHKGGREHPLQWFPVAFLYPSPASQGFSTRSARATQPIIPKRLTELFTQNLRTQPWQTLTHSPFHHHHHHSSSSQSLPNTVPTTPPPTHTFLMLHLLLSSPYAQFLETTPQLPPICWPRDTLRPNQNKSVCYSSWKGSQPALRGRTCSGFWGAIHLSDIRYRIK